MYFAARARLARCERWDQIVRLGLTLLTPKQKCADDTTYKIGSFVETSRRYRRPERQIERIIQRLFTNATR